MVWRDKWTFRSSAGDIRSRTRMFSNRVGFAGAFLGYLSAGGFTRTCLKLRPATWTATSMAPFISSSFLAPLSFFCETSIAFLYPASGPPAAFSHLFSWPVPRFSRTCSRLSDNASGFLLFCTSLTSIVFARVSLAAAEPPSPSDATTAGWFGLPGTGCRAWPSFLQRLSACYRYFAGHFQPFASSVVRIHHILVETVRLATHLVLRASNTVAVNHTGLPRLPNSTTGRFVFRVSVLCGLRFVVLPRVTIPSFYSMEPFICAFSLFLSMVLSAGRRLYSTFVSSAKRRCARRRRTPSHVGAWSKALINRPIWTAWLNAEPLLEGSPSAGTRVIIS